MSTSSQIMCRLSLLAPFLAIALLFGAAGCATTNADGKPKPKMRTVCAQQDSASGSRLTRRVCRQVEVKPAAEAATDAESDAGSDAESDANR